MKINQVNATHFGCLKGKIFEFGDGINIVMGDNASGKSTLHSLIRALLYGMRRGRGRAARSDQYSRFEPWDADGLYAGSMRFSCGDREFQLSRSFGKSDKNDTLVCITDGEEMSIRDGDLKVLLGDVSENVFVNTVCISQLRARTDETLSAEMNNFVANYQMGSDGRLDVSGAIADLRTQKKEQNSLIRKSYSEHEKHLAELASRVDYMREEIYSLKKELEIQSQRLENERQKANLPSNQNADSQKSTAMQKYFEDPKKKAVYLITAILITVAFFLLKSIYAKAICVIIAILAIIAFILTLHLNSRRESLNTSNPGTENEETVKLKWSISRLEDEIREKQIKLTNASNEYDDMSPAPKSEQALEMEAIDLAIETISSLSSNMQTKVDDILRKNTEKIISELTENDIEKVYMKNSECTGVYERGRPCDVESLSRGSIEQLYLAFRIAAAQLICKSEPLPILLDEVFAMYDDNRLKKALALLGNMEKQVIIFSCNRREIEALEKLSIPYRAVSL